MPKIHRRIPKAIYNLFCRRFNVNLSLNTLGSNKKIKTFITIFKKNHHHAFVNPELIDIVKEFSLFESDKVDLKMKVSTKTLSSGQMQKISFIRALLNKVEILILDESTSNLDKKTKDLIFKLLSLRKITIINSTHNEEDFLFDNHIQVTIDEEKRKLILR